MDNIVSTLTDDHLTSGNLGCVAQFQATDHQQRQTQLDEIWARQHAAALDEWMDRTCTTLREDEYNEQQRMDLVEECRLELGNAPMVVPLSFYDKMMLEHYDAMMESYINNNTSNHL